MKNVTLEITENGSARTVTYATNVEAEQAIKDLKISNPAAVCALHKEPLDHGHTHAHNPQTADTPRDKEGYKGQR